ncbi:hypothetical protein P879_01165 [Paragonimus westermani]|uniref:PHD finger protein 14 n=1 Tax=Paragonimus westermani TaxID=34504 RepID=A0A8T0DSY3_9TREM|nr:hypothetical protein P879_01165 [Paragonimus westermani]
MRNDSNKKQSTDIEQLFSAIARRDPSKRQIKPVATSQLALFDELEDDSDSEFVCDDQDDEGHFVCLFLYFMLDSELDDSASDSSCESSEKSSTSEKSESKDVVHETANESVFGMLAKDEAVTSLANLPAESSFNTNAIHGLEAESVRHECDEVNNKSFQFLVCMVCLGDSDDPNDELIECDGCGIVVHEDCYKIVDSIFLSSGASSSSTDAWFCEPCLAGVHSPLCELCPNPDGAFKRTDNHRWVHLLCALYTPGVAFNDTENLMDVTLTELAPKAWSSHECSLCDERFFAWTGVCIACDAGLCRTFFHVTCAQKYGLLSEPTVDENTVDPFFAQCRQHTDKNVARRRRQNYLTAMNRLRLKRKRPIDAVPAEGVEFGSSISTSQNISGQLLYEPRIQRKLEHFRALYADLLKIREKPYVPPVKAPLFLENSAIAMRLFVIKAKTLQLPMELTGQTNMNESSKALPLGYPVFSPEFISYFSDREKRISELLVRISSLQDTQRELQIADASASHSYNSVSTQLDNVTAKRADLRTKFNVILTSLKQLIPELKPSPALEAILEEPSRPPEMKVGANCSQTSVNTTRHSLHSGRLQLSRRSTSQTPHLSRTGVHRMLKRKASTHGSNGLSESTDDRDVPMDSERVSGHTDYITDSVILECFVCHGLQDQHLITKCDTCGKAFHLACLDPPLLRMPKRSKLYGWQCSYCTKAVASNTEGMQVDVNAPRQLRRSAGKAVEHRTVTVSSNDAAQSVCSKESNESDDTSREKSNPKTESLYPTVSLSSDPPPSSAVECVRSRRSRTVEIGRAPRNQATRARIATPFSVPTTTSTKARNAKNLSIRRCFMSTAARKRQRQSVHSSVKSGAVYESTLSTTQPTILVTQVDVPNVVKIPNNTKPEPGKFDAYEYSADPNSDEEIARLRASKVIKFVQIRDHCHNSDSESVEHIAPLHMRYMICRDSGNSGHKKSTPERFRMKLKKL